MEAKEALPINKIEKGQFKGSVIDNRTRRSLEIVKEDEDYFWVDYFFHLGDFYSAKIPKNAITDIIGQRFSFGSLNPFVNHAQVRLIFNNDRPIEVFKLGTKSEEKLFSLIDIVYSIEVVGPKGEAWTFSKAFGTFVSAHRVLSIDEVVFERIVLGGYQIIQSPPLKLSQTQKNRALELIIKRSNKARMNERYYLINSWLGANNCTSEVFKILDEVSSENYSFSQKLFSKLLWRLPLALRWYLRIRGSINNKIRYQDLNDEFLELAVSKKMSRRLKNLKNKGVKIQT